MAIQKKNHKLIPAQLINLFDMYDMQQDFFFKMNIFKAHKRIHTNELILSNSTMRFHLLTKYSTILFFKQTVIQKKKQ